MRMIPSAVVQVVVVDVASEQVQDAAGDQRQGHQSEAHDLAKNLSDRHAASIPAE